LKEGPGLRSTSPQSNKSSLIPECLFTELEILAMLESTKNKGIIFRQRINLVLVMNGLLEKKNKYKVTE
jgi:hypothetical protein